MPLRIRLSGSAAHADDLVAYLQRLGADARKEGNAVTVTRRHRPIPGEPRSQDRTELEFVVRVWAASNPDADFRIEEAA